MKIGIASDHRGYKLKKELIDYLKNNNYEVYDYGTNNEEKVDYPVYAFKLCEDINLKIEKGILICGTGIGMSIAANKVKGIRCAKVNNKNEAKLCREHNDANVIALSEELEIESAKEIIDIFMKTDFSNLDKHVRRNKMVDEYASKL